MAEKALTGPLIAHTHAVRGVLSETADGDYILNAGFSRLRFTSDASAGSDFCVAIDCGLDPSFLDCPASSIKVVVLHEPRELNPSLFSAVEHFMPLLNLVISYDPEMLSKYPEKVRQYWVGGSYLGKTERLSGLTKFRNVSLSASKKNQLEGHKLRHVVIDEYRARGLVPMGGGYRKYKSWGTPYSRFRFSVVIENSSGPSYFSEKLIHCLLFRCIPVYWGAAVLPDEFAPEGIFAFRDIGAISGIWPKLTRKTYKELEPYVTQNQLAAIEYCSTELNLQRIIAPLLGFSGFSPDLASNYFDDFSSLISGSAPFAPLNYAGASHWSP